MIQKIYANVKLENRHKVGLANLIFGSSQLLAVYHQCGQPLYHDGSLARLRTLLPLIVFLNKIRKHLGDLLRN